MTESTEQRNLNPTPEALIAMMIWGKEYSEQRGGSMDFWDTLGTSRKLQCFEGLNKIKALLQSQLRKEIEGVIGKDDKPLKDGHPGHQCDYPSIRNDLRSEQRTKLLNLLQETK